MSSVQGFQELAKAFSDVAANLPRTDLTKAVKRGADIVKPAIVSAAPKRTGALRGGIILHRERKRGEGKVVYDIMMDAQKNDIFQKPVKNPVRTKKGKHAYYPASQEYGFYTRRPDGGMTYNSPTSGAVKMAKVPGKHYMRTGAEVRGEMAKEVIAGQLMESIENRLGG